jgi:hypothetical protein
MGQMMPFFLICRAPVDAKKAILAVAVHADCVWLLVSLSGSTAQSRATARIDHPTVPAWQPWCWEWSSALLMLALVPVVIAVERRWPLRVDTWRQMLPLHLLASILFSLIHVGGMAALRKPRTAPSKSSGTFVPDLTTSKKPRAHGSLFVPMGGTSISEGRRLEIMQELLAAPRHCLSGYFLEPLHSR